MRVRVVLATVGAVTASGQDIERDPIHYSAATPRNVVSRLQERLAAGKAKLVFERDRGYLRSVLRELDVPESSQVLVFSKTSLQRDRISPRTPRAIYFNDDVMVGFCLRGEVMEISAVNDLIGTAFYTLDQSHDEKPVPQRQTESCLICHSSSANLGIPGHLVRSLFVDRQGNPLLASGSYRTDHTSPLAERWGGWYVTGTSGRQKHMGNIVYQGPRKPDESEDGRGVNVVDLKDRFRMAPYLSPHSDIVALMVLEHQAGMLNRLARAGMETRMALHYEREINKALGRPAEERSESTRSRIRSVGEEVVQYMLFNDEARLSEPIQGTILVCVRLRRSGAPRREGPFPPRPRPQDPALSLSVQLSDLFPGLQFSPRRREGLSLSTTLGDPRRPEHREGRPSARPGRSRGDPRDPPRDQAGSARMLEDHASAPSPN